MISVAVNEGFEGVMADPEKITGNPIDEICDFDSAHTCCPFRFDEHEQHNRQHDGGLPKRGSAHTPPIGGGRPIRRQFGYEQKRHGCENQWQEHLISQPGCNNTQDCKNLPSPKPTVPAAKCPQMGVNTE